jgi:hypothetical protein
MSTTIPRKSKITTFISKTNIVLLQVNYWLNNIENYFVGGLLIDKLKLIQVNLDRDCETCVRNQRLQEL